MNVAATMFVLVCSSLQTTASIILRRTTWAPALYGPRFPPAPSFTVCSQTAVGPYSHAFDRLHTVLPIISVAPLNSRGPPTTGCLAQTTRFRRPRPCRIEEWLPSNSARPSSSSLRFPVSSVVLSFFSSSSDVVAVPSPPHSLPSNP